MKRLLAMACVCCAVLAALGRTARAQEAHPAVVRVVAPERDATSYGSGALVAVSHTYGLVVTNWHVVCDATGPILVVFPDGFRSGASVLRVDRDWDLAALVVWRPRAQPLVLAGAAPQLGETLSIAGYGKGWYRMASGPCTQYLSPGRNLPYEMVELAAPARQGDSGGPILNSRGELAGVLFGTGFGRTIGSYCGRVRLFLASAADGFYRLPSAPTMIAQQPRSEPAPLAAIEAQPWPRAAEGAGAGAVRPGSSGGAAGVPAPPRLASSAPPTRRDLVTGSAQQPRQTWPPAAGPRQVQPQPTAGGSLAAATPPAASPAAMPSRAEQIKTILAAIGAIALLFHGLRVLGAAAGS